MTVKTVGIIGLGLIGGSMALDLQRRGYAERIVGVEQDPVHAAAAGTIGLVDAVLPYEQCLAEADIVVVAIPVGAAVPLVTDILNHFRDGAASGDGIPWRDKIVIDVCSTKEMICLETRYHPSRGQFVSTHPMAGTEYSGPWAAMEGMFDGRACIIANAEESDPKALTAIEALYDCLHMRPIRMDAAQHDIHTAYVSHISHVTSFALALTVLDKEKDEKHIFDLASGGFSSTVRLAKSSADMWVPILTQNRDNVLQVIDTYIEKMQAFRDAIAVVDAGKIRSLIEDANHIKKIIR